VPDSAEAGEPVPVVLEALPYRKDDATASYRPAYERLCGEYGYAVARVDLRGDADAYEVRLDLEAREGDEPRWSRTWRRGIPATWADCEDRRGPARPGSGEHGIDPPFSFCP
jgi:X-Pro dipeptidyl-peptidase (S15 family)